MIDDPLGAIDYDESGAGPTVVLLPGSCATGAAFRPMIEAWGGRFRTVTTSLLGYGGTAERRTPADPAMAHETDAVEAVIHRAGDGGAPVHLVGHSFGGLVAVAVALRRAVPLASVTVLEAPAMVLLAERAEDAEHALAFSAMNESYFAAFARGEKDAAAAMIDFYGGAGTYASWPDRVRGYVAETAAVNIIDWQTAYGFPLTSTTLAGIALPSLVLWGGASNPAAQRANARLGQAIPGASAGAVQGAAHFMIATHPREVAARIADHVAAAGARPE